MDAAYEQWHERMAVREGTEATLQSWHQTVLRLLPDLAGKCVLEIGCGRGDFALLLARQFPVTSFTAIDFSERAIELAKCRARASGLDVDFQVGDAQKLGFRDNRFDFVISCECLEHVPAPQRMTSEIARCLRPNGGFILTTENYFNGMIIAWLKCWLTKQPFDSGSGVQPRENFFVFWKVQKLLERAGLEVTHTESNHFQWLLLPRCAPNKLCTETFRSARLNRIFQPFGRHFAFQGSKPS